MESAPPEIASSTFSLGSKRALSFMKLIIFCSNLFNIVRKKRACGFIQARLVVQSVMVFYYLFSGMTTFVNSFALVSA